jgi:predicted nucleotide-binding protein
MSLKFEKTQKEFKDLLFASGIMGKWVNMVSKYRFRWDNGGSFDWWPKNGIIMFEGASQANDRLKLLLFKILFNVAEIKETPFLQLKTKVFVVCGEDKQAQDQLEQVLGELNLGPNVLASNNEKGLFIAEALEAQKTRKEDKVFGIVLLTADFHGTRKVNDLDKAKPMYGPGLMLETGLLLSTLKTDQLVIVSREGMVLPTKIRGINYLNYKNSIAEVKSGLIQQMTKAGLSPSVKKTPVVEKPADAKTTPKSINPNPNKNPPAFI